MASSNDTQVFIIRIWSEPREIEQASPEWRGMVEHVSSDQRRYFKSLDEMVAFMLPHIRSLGVEPTFCWRLRQWLRRWKLPKEFIAKV
jgi:hypothetical protein